MRELCSILARGEETYRICVKALSSIARRGYFRANREDALTRQFMDSLVEKNIVKKTRLQVCGTSRHVTVYVSVDPRNPADSPAMLLAQLLPMLNQHAITCYDEEIVSRVISTAEPPAAAMEILCRIYGVRGPKMMETCIGIVRDLVRYGVAIVRRGENRRQKLLQALREKGFVMKIEAPRCDKPTATRNVYTVDNKRFTPVKNQLMALLHAPPACIKSA